MCLRECVCPLLARTARVILLLKTALSIARPSAPPRGRPKVAKLNSSAAFGRLRSIVAVVSAPAATLHSSRLRRGTRRSRELWRGARALALDGGDYRIREPGYKITANLHTRKKEKGQKKNITKKYRSYRSSEKFSATILCPSL